MSERPVLFLDVDGVLNHDASPGWQDTHRVLDDACVAQLRRLSAVADVVLSSVWRLDTDEQLRELQERCGVRLLDATPYLSQQPRSAEIKAWLAAHPSVTLWAILDDEADADLGDGSFFRTNFTGGGLTPAIADAVLARIAPNVVPPTVDRT